MKTIPLNSEPSSPELVSESQSADVQRKLVEALRAIRDSPHCSYDDPSVGGSSYGTGVVDGHRCAANIAREALLLLEGEQK